MKNVFILSFLALSSFASAQIIHFPDAKFKNALVNTKCVDTDGDGVGDSDADLNNDGEIDQNESLYIINLFVESLNINSLKGIEHFTNLLTLNCQKNKIVEINISNLSNLKNLNCGFNEINKLSLSNNKALVNLHCGNNLIHELDLTGLDNLELLYCAFNLFTELNIIDLKELSELNCSNGKLEKLNLKNLPKLKNLTCNSNKLQSLILPYLPELTRIGCSYNSIESFQVDSIAKSGVIILCSFNKIKELDLTSLKFMWQLDCQNNNLTSLKLDGVRLFHLSCQNNLFTSLFLKQINNLSTINFSNNPNLRYICCNEKDVEKLVNQVLVNGMKNCEVNSYCSFTPGGEFYVLNGENKYDYNINGCDDQDFKLPNFKFNITNGNNSGTFISNSTGGYKIPLHQGTHTITPIIEYPNHFEVTPSSFSITFPSTADTITQNFCITPKGIFNKVNITVLPLSPPARPGFSASYKIVWENVGTQIENGSLNFTYDESLLDYISASQTADQIADGILKWNFTNLLPFEKREITVTLKVNRPTDTPAVNAGDKLYLTASILDNIFTLENTVVGPYDPNDKTCLQGDRVKPDMVGEFVDYLIRFENTGNYAAENVVVKDIIDTKTFDISTLKITDASHEVYTRIEGNKVEFIFENIQLPFDDANNDGYIAFKIKTLPTLVPGDSLKNLADIYFDYNFPIRTNEAQTTVALPVSTTDWTTDVKIYPNPVRDILHISTEEIWTKAEIYDISGRIVRSLTLDGTSVDVSGLESGTYFIRLKNGGKISRVKFVKL
ncbi:MAG: T9SS type A sorting domain-containing protein [Saprospiraceae bacterium]|nr:T9SS type A sorting domain-containing protein [Saprospiraceae bacterium]